jgi:hypothetical protein
LTIASGMFCTTLVAEEIPAEKPFLERGDIFTILRQNEVQSDLDLVADQKQKVAQLAFERMKLISKEGSDFERAPNPEGRAAVNAEFRDKIRAYDAEAMELLLPHQRTRVRQITAQWLTRVDVKSFGVLHAEVKKLLSLTPEQEAEMRLIADEEHAAIEKKVAEFQTQIAKMRQDARSKMLEKLTKEQRDKIEATFGEPLKFKN